MKKGILISIGLIVLVAILASAAFVGGQLLYGQELPGQTAASGGMNLMSSQEGKQAQMVQDQRIPAKELPQTPADVRGVFDHRKDNSIIVGTGIIISDLKKDQSGNVTSFSTYSGPTVEVVVTPQTIVYCDVTNQQFSEQPPSGKIQQVVEQASLDDIGKDSLIHAWGKKTGDRIIADVLVYTPPTINGRRVGG